MKPKKSERTLTLIVTVPFPREATRSYIKAYVKDAVEYWSGQDNPDDWTFYFARGRTKVRSARRGEVQS